MSQARLQVNDSTHRLVAVDKNLFSIGSRSSADLQIVGSYISREHSEISCHGGQYLLSDCDSRHGTFVNGRSVTHQPLEDGDSIRLGGTNGIELVFRIVEDVPGRWPTSTGIDTQLSASSTTTERAQGPAAALDETLNDLVDSALEATKAQRGFVLLANAHGDLDVKIARGSDQKTLSDSPFTISTFHSKCFAQARAVLCPASSTTTHRSGTT